jgi:hypothetical protein
MNIRSIIKSQIKTLLIEGGHAFDNVTTLFLDDFNSTFAAIKSDLQAIGCTNVIPIGSSGKKQLMGDLDVAADFDGDRGTLFKLAQQKFGVDTVKSLGSNIVSISYPIVTNDPNRLGDRVQVDVMLGKTSFLAWGKYGTSTNEKHKDFSRLKGAARNILFNSITRVIAEIDFPGQQDEWDRLRYMLDSDIGLQKVHQTRRNKASSVPLKAWKTVSRDVVSDDPNAIVKMIFGDEFNAFDITTFEKTVDVMYTSRRVAPYANKILDDFYMGLGDLVKSRPELIFNTLSVEEGMAYIQSIIDSRR